MAAVIIGNAYRALVNAWRTHRLQWRRISDAEAQFFRAREIFLDVMSGSRPVAEARLAFLRAAEEADLDISGN
ncbi:DUF982 domain-containing protein [Neorhizobium sp. 2083]|uniref:DUF982 domain-containing protein n=1 Tax=Neorhizobium sp. 2083 TaxID=2817762 RepID=UPI0038620F0B